MSSGSIFFLSAIWRHSFSRVGLTEQGAGGGGGVLIQNDHIFTRSQYHQLTVGSDFSSVAVQELEWYVASLAWRRVPLSDSEMEIAFFSKLLIGEGRAERKRRLALICYGNSRQKKKSLVTHPEASVSNKAKAGAKQLCCLLNLTACQTLTAKVRSNISQIRVPSSECVVNFISVCCWSMKKSGYGYMPRYDIMRLSLFLILK